MKIAGTPTIAERLLMARRGSLETVVGALCVVVPGTLVSASSARRAAVGSPRSIGSPPLDSAWPEHSRTSNDQVSRAYEREFWLIGLLNSEDFTTTISTTVNFQRFLNGVYLCERIGRPSNSLNQICTHGHDTLSTPTGNRRPRVVNRDQLIPVPTYTVD